MLDLRSLRNRAIRQGMKLVSDPRVMKLMSNPRVMKWMLQALALRSTMKGAVDARGRALAKRFQLATAEEVATLRSRVRELESTVEMMRGEVEVEHGRPEEEEG